MWIACENEKLFNACIILYCVCYGLLLLIDILFIIIASLAAALKSPDKPLENIQVRRGDTTDEFLRDYTGEDGDYTENAIDDVVGDYVREMQSVKEFRVTASKESLSYAKADEFCKRNNKHLPQPQNQKAEDKIIADIRTSEAASCRYVFFAYVANPEFRYESSKSDAILPSLKEWKEDDESPFQFTDCYELQSSPSGQPRVISERECDNITAKNLLLLKIFTDFCRHHRYRCVEIYETASNDVVPVSFSKAKTADSTVVPVPYDKNNHPENLRLRHLSQSGPFVVLATKYRFQYEFGDVQQRYESKRFTVIDPEYDCLAYDTARDKMITRSCESRACPICY